MAAFHFKDTAPMRFNCVKTACATALFLLACCSAVPAAEPPPTIEGEQAGVKTEYDKVFQKLSPEGRLALAKAQDDWQGFVKSYCDKDNLRFNYKNTDDCVLEKTYERHRQMRGYLAVTAEGLVIRQAEYFAVHIVDISDDPDDGRVKWPADVHITWPQIDNPKTEAQQNWNKLMAKGMPGDETEGGNYCQLSEEYGIYFSAADFLSIQKNDWFYCHGTPHGQPSDSNSNWILSVPRKLEAGDIFEAGSGWEKALTGAVAKKLEAQGKSIYEEGEEKYIGEPDLWAVSDKSITINLGKVDGYANGDFVAEIPWRELQPYLTHKFSFIPAK